MTNPTMRASVTSDAQGLKPGDPATILIDGADTACTANGLQGYTPMPGDRILVQQVGQTMEVMQFLSLGAVPGVATIRQTTAPSTTTTPLNTIWYDQSNANTPYRLEIDPVTLVPTWEPLTIDSRAMDVVNVRAKTVEAGFVLGGGGVGVLSAGATNPTAGPVVSNYWPQWNSTFYSAGSDMSAFFAGMDDFANDSTKWVSASIFGGTQIRVFNKSDGALTFFPDLTNGKAWVDQFYSWGGIAQDGQNYWLIGSDNDRSVDVYIYAIDKGSFNKTAELRLGTSNTFGGFYPRMVSDKVNNRMGMIWIPSSGNLMLRWYAVSGGAISQVGSDIILKTGVGRQNIGDATFGDQGTGLGASTLYVAIEADGTTLPNVMCWSSVSTTAATRQSSYDFKKPNGSAIHAMGFNVATGHFQVIDKTGVVRETSQIAQVGGSSTSITARYTYYDGDTGNYAGTVGSGTVIINGVDVSGTASTAHETGYSPTTNFTTYRRAWVRVTTGHPPDETNLDATKVDRANRIGCYVAIGGGTMWRQAYGTWAAGVSQIVFDGFETFPGSGTPDTHLFTSAQQSLGVFQSAGTRADGLPKFYVDGTGGQSYMDGLVPPGTIMMWTNATPPAGWYLCNGASKTTAAEPDLFNTLGYKFGGSGANFNLPDLRGRIVLGSGGLSNVKATIGDFETGASGTAAGQGDDNRMNHQHTHGAGTNVSVATNTTATGASNRVSNAPATLWTDQQGVGGSNQLYHAMLVLTFIIKR